jgi:hypothetical protein
VKHYKLVSQVNNTTWADSKFFPPGTCNSALEYLQQTFETIQIRPFLLQCNYRLLFFSEVFEDWFPLTSGSLADILQFYKINISSSSNIVEILT